MKTQRYMRQKLPVVLVAGLGGLFTVVDLACAQPWATTDAPGLSWSALAASADGTRLVAAAAPIYVSTNAGANWTQTSAPNNNWHSVACSADGTKLVAVASSFGPTGGRGDGLIYTSPDAGASWSASSAPSNTWSGVASSADGAKLVAVAAVVWDGSVTNYVGDGATYRSSDAGATWTRTSAPSNNWTSVASSADGAKLVAVAAPFRDYSVTSYVGEGAIYRSADAGATWTRTSAPSNHWTSVASSADGTKLVAAATGVWDDSVNNFVGEDAIYLSADAGATWTRTSAPGARWSAVASSADGTRLVAAWLTICTSGDAGVTWTATAAPSIGEHDWTAVASSADGYRVAAAWSGGIYTLPYSGPWRLADVLGGQKSVASSADGSKLIATAGVYVYSSSNSGATWTPITAPTNLWSSVASSADGTKLVAADSRHYAWMGDGLIYTSENSGATWKPTSAPSNRWASVASSADGTKLVAVSDRFWDGSVNNYVGEGTIYRSGDGGATWTLTSAPRQRWSSVASSTDGTKLVAASGEPGLVYTSADSGQSWTQTSAPTTYYWQSVASSADGAKLVAAGVSRADVNIGRIYTSSDSGVTWTLTSAPAERWTCVASSADGTMLVAAARTLIYVSTNSGATWTPAGAPAEDWWYAVASSADGSHIVAVGSSLICTLQSPAPAPPVPPSPRLAIECPGPNIGLSWLVPSTRFVLQQNSDSGSTNWVDVPAPPTLDYTNLHHRLALTPSLGSSYFRLKQQ